MQKHDNDLVKYSKSIIEQTGKSLDRYDPDDDIFKQYKNLFKKIKNDERKKNTRRKKNIKNFIKKNKTIIDKHKEETELEINENITKDVYKEFKRLVKQLEI